MTSAPLGNSAASSVRGSALISGSGTTRRLLSTWRFFCSSSMSSTSYFPCAGSQLTTCDRVTILNSSTIKSLGDAAPQERLHNKENKQKIQFSSLSETRTSAATASPGRATWPASGGTHSYNGGLPPPGSSSPPCRRRARARPRRRRGAPRGPRRAARIVTTEGYLRQDPVLLLVGDAHERGHGVAGARHVARFSSLSETRTSAATASPGRATWPASGGTHSYNGGLPPPGSSSPPCRRRARARPRRRRGAPRGPRRAARIVTTEGYLRQDPVLLLVGDAHERGHGVAGARHVARFSSLSETRTSAATASPGRATWPASGGTHSYNGGLPPPGSSSPPCRRRARARPRRRRGAPRGPRRAARIVTTEGYLRQDPVLLLVGDAHERGHGFSSLSETRTSAATASPGRATWPASGGTHSYNGGLPPPGSSSPPCRRRARARPRRRRGAPRGPRRAARIVTTEGYLRQDPVLLLVGDAHERGHGVAGARHVARVGRHA
ncbi:hypothetical protein ACJJTC_003133 [Scirpophaga incertulas]